MLTTPEGLRSSFTTSQNLFTNSFWELGKPTQGFLLLFLPKQRLCCAPRTTTSSCILFLCLSQGGKGQANSPPSQEVLFSEQNLQFCWKWQNTQTSKHPLIPSAKQTNTFSVTQAINPEVLHFRHKSTSSLLHSFIEHKSQFHVVASSTYPISNNWQITTQNITVDLYFPKIAFFFFRKFSASYSSCPLQKAYLNVR